MAPRQYDSAGGRPGGGRGAVVPADLKRALENERAAQEAFDALPPSHRRAYVEWIEEAKRQETRAQRIAGTVERLREPESAGSDPTDAGSDPKGVGSDPTGLTP